MATKTTEWRPGPTVCRCCLAEGCYKDISTEYFWMGKREVYAEMLANTFDLSIAYSQSGGPYSNSRLICEPCISRLRDAADFKRQVVECEKTFLQHLDPSCSADTVVNVSAVVPLEDDREVKIEGVKVERLGSEDELDDSANFNNDDDDDDDLDDQPLTKLASKCSKKDSVDLLDIIDNAKVADKRKSTVKVKATPVKKVKMKKEAKATASKAKPEKKKKGSDSSAEKENGGIPTEQLTERNARVLNDVERSLETRRKNTMLLLEYSKICPFRWTKRNLYLCFYCGQQFSDPDTLRAHNSLEHSTPSLTQIKYELFKHKKHELVKVDITDIGCKLCDEPLQDITSLKYHLSERHDKNIDTSSNDGILPFKITMNTFLCTICGQRCDEFKSLNHHMNVHFQNYICEQCGTGFITSDRLRTHSLSHENGAVACEECEKVFRSTIAKNEHYATVHKQVRRHRCPHCTETFRNYFQRNKHVASVHGLKLKEFKCNLCPKVFTLSGKLGVHVRTVHLKLKRFACNVCEWKFYSKSELQDHMVRHGGERKFQCSVCKKAYARKYTLREHMRIHDNDRRFVCPECGRSFVQNCSLKHHARVQHPGTVLKAGVSYQDVIPRE
ncbi:oocyte zinc finger protein XlCOF6-like isoform X4 [Battus philenor]|uniref:oocyte zinc finger protein XlCOF6-like isoform X4 n=1 Tax=Battus philenor TaxID=42288 RepID=UPI0035CFA737